ncbi:hypothetical protein IEQ34_016510 [Dendrobium chrysotoxum]|uniref:Pentatricopeptide repeat-containing protein n=1 Tax=Dendrobium chrysotoxum TaxID=161865 RepID=A0AAV7GDN9_DENCH|nr:hypothetical protein IEQ34_016510 [Dendrobium chrysotoxum]
MRLLPARRALKLQARILFLSRLTSFQFHIFCTQSTEISSAVPLTSLQCGHLFQSLTNSRSYRKGQQLHTFMLISGVLIDNTYLATKLSAFYAICGKMEEARVIFNGIMLKSSFLWNMMIRGFSCSGFPLNALFMYRQMLGFGKKADNFTYPFVLMASGDLLLDDVGKRIHCEVIVNGYEADVYVSNSLLAMYSKFGDMETAQKVFDRMLVRDITSWNTIISGYVYDAHPEKGLSIFVDMILDGFRCDQVSFLGVLSACSDLGAFSQGKEIHAYVLRTGVEFSSFLSNALIDVYVKSNFLAGAKRLHEMMYMRDTISWNTVIFGCARYGYALESLHLFHQMNYEGISLDFATFLAVLGACGQLAALHLGKNLHAHLSKLGLDHEVFIGTALIDMYAKCGSLAHSCQIFDEMPTKNLISWSAMVSAYGLHGRGEEAVDFFNQMKKKGIKPDKVTFTSVLSACSHAGLVDSGKEIFLQMQHRHAITPSVKQYSCMVDLLGRAGHLDEAYKLILDMEVIPNVDVWAALLAACQIHHNVEMAEIAAQHAFNVRPQGFGVYISLSNIYAKEKRWDDVKRVRALARRDGLRKPPGCSYFELDLEIHRFLVGDKSHPQSNAMHAKLVELKRMVKEAGYIPETSSVFYEVEVELKEKIL